jgi:hypothetical protein
MSYAYISSSSSSSNRIYRNPCVYCGRLCGQDDDRYCVICRNPIVQCDSLFDEPGGGRRSCILPRVHNSCLALRCDITNCHNNMRHRGNGHCPHKERDETRLFRRKNITGPCTLCKDPLCGQAKCLVCYNPVGICNTDTQSVRGMPQFHLSCVNPLIAKMVLDTWESDSHMTINNENPIETPKKVITAAPKRLRTPLTVTPPSVQKPRHSPVKIGAQPPSPDGNNGRYANPLLIETQVDKEPTQLLSPIVTNGLHVIPPSPIVIDDSDDNESRPPSPVLFDIGQLVSNSTKCSWCHTAIGPNEPRKIGSCGGHVHSYCK